MFDHFPSTIRREWLRNVKEFGEVIEEMIQKGREARASNKKDQETETLLGQLLDLPQSQDVNSNHTLVGLLGDLMMAGIDTSANTIHWAMIFLANHPECQDKLREEVHDVLGYDTTYTDDVYDRLPYLSAVINETMRASCLVPIPPPHIVEKDFTVNGYDIPKGTWIMHNLFTQLKDETVFPNPTVFNPDRFLEQSMDDPVECRNILFPIFGVGPRQCPGARLSAMEVRVGLCMFVQKFKWRPSHRCHA